MKSSALCSMMLTLCLTLTTHSPLAANAKAQIANSDEQGLIDQICSQTSKEEKNCQNILKADPNVVQAKDIFEFSKAVLELALNKGKEGQNFLKGLINNKSSPAISLCANEFYSGVVGSFSSALAELKVSPDTASYDSKVAGDGAVNCEEALANAHIVNPAISALNSQTSLLSNIAFLATNQLSHS